MPRTANRRATHLVWGTTWGLQKPLNSECLIDECLVAADCEVHVSLDGLPLRYAACSEHGYDISWGVLEAHPTETNRGFIGLS